MGSRPEPGSVHLSPAAREALTLRRLAEVEVFGKLAALLVGHLEFCEEVFVFHDHLPLRYRGDIRPQSPMGRQVLFRTFASWFRLSFAERFRAF